MRGSAVAPWRLEPTDDEEELGGFVASDLDEDEEFDDLEGDEDDDFDDDEDDEDLDDDDLEDDDDDDLIDLDDEYDDVDADERPHPGRFEE